LQKDPDKRYQTMAELGQAVERAVAGMGVADDDIGAFVRGVMGDRGAKRRSAVRDAVRVADERYATGTHALVAFPQAQQAQTIHEGGSEMGLTKLNPGVKDGAMLDRPSTVTPPTVSVLPPPSSPWNQPEPHGTTDQPVMVPDTLPHGVRSRAGLFAG